MSDVIPKVHKMIGFCNRDEKCLFWGMNWVSKYDRLRFVHKGLDTNSYAALWVT
jgi:hypothetical protein